MAVAVAVVARDATSLKRVIATVTFSGTYTTGGETPAPALLKALDMSRLHIAHFTQDDVSTTQGMVPRVDRATGKLMLFEGGAAVDSAMKEVSSGQSLTGAIFRAEFVGEGNN